jgi:arylsulfatase A-like enzyme
MERMISLRNPCLAVAAIVLAGCSSGAPPEGNNALLITLDTTRADALSCYGALPGLTPCLDELADGGVLFERAYTVAPLTLPSHSSMLTGLYPPRHTLRLNSDSSLPLSAKTLAEIARSEDIETAAIISSVVLDEAYRLDQGFEHYDAPFRAGHSKTTHFPDRTCDEALEGVERWIEERDRGRRFFLWVHLWDAHPPWSPSPEFLRRSRDNPYLAEVARVDDTVGKIVERLRAQGMLESTVILVVGDHGEAFLEHGESSHGAYCYEPTMRVPMILRYPDGERAGERNEGIVSVVDVYPTLAEALALPIPPGLDGRSLYGDPLPADRGVYFESLYGYVFYSWSPIWGWIDGEGKYVHSTEPEFFQITSDPGELENLFASPPEDLERYRDAIRTIAARPALERGDAVALDGGLGADLAALGYASSGTRQIELPPPLTETGLPAAATTAEEHQLIIRAGDLLSAGDLEGAEALFREALERNPSSNRPREVIGFFLMEAGKHAEAAEQFWRIMASGRGSASAAANLGICHRQAGRKDMAIHWFEKALEIDTNEVSAIRQLSQVHAEMGHEEQAAAYGKRYEELTGEKLPSR